jgi:hypothetical protein
LVSPTNLKSKIRKRKPTPYPKKELAEIAAQENERVPSHLNAIQRIKYKAKNIPTASKFSKGKSSFTTASGSMNNFSKGCISKMPPIPSKSRKIYSEPS